MNIKLIYNGDSGDGKRAFYYDENSELRFDVDTDDVSDKDQILRIMDEVVKRVNQGNQKN